MTSVSDRPPEAALLRGLARLLRPLVRLLIQRGVTYPAVAELLRELYVDVARNDLLRAPGAQTDSRISLVTGVHRKEVRRQRTRPPAASAPPPSGLSLSSQIIARWLATPPWSSEDGTPRPLPRVAAGGEASFDALVESVTRDLRPRAVLDEWLNQGLVGLDPEDRVVLNTAAYLPRPGGEEQLFYFARNLHDHIAAASANVAATGRAPFLDRSVHYDRLSPAVAERLEALARKAAERLLVEINRAALRLTGAEPEAAPGTSTRRVNLGVYLYSDDEPPEGDAR
jgi:hypothetical protein